MRSRFNWTVITSALLLLAIARPATATTIVSNLAESSSASVGVSLLTQASSFTTGGGSETLSDLNLAIYSSPFQPGKTRVRLYSDAGGQPGTVLEDLGIISPGGYFYGVYSVASIGTVLAPNTTYWVALGEVASCATILDPACGDLSWSGTLSTAETSPAGWTIGNTMWLSFDGAVTWVPRPGGADFIGQFSVDVVPDVVPEPSAGLLVLTGMLGLAIWPRRRE